jgi:hypothetical protein
MNKILKLAAVILTLNISTVDAKITQTIDRTEISAGETFVLDIQTDSASDESPDLSMIPADITIVSNSQYQNIQIINGRRSGIKGWKLKLKTLKPGQLIIPAIEVGNEFTKPITLNIKESSFRVDVNGQKDAIFLKAEVDQESPYVQQQIIYTVSLYRSISTHYENLSTPVVENSIVEKLGDDVVFETMLNNIRYTVYQRKYLIFPQQSGDMVIGPVNFTADVNDSKRKSRSLFLNSTRPISVSTQPINLQVKAKPTQSSNPWLPAENVTLVDQWTSDTANANTLLQLKVGEPATWTIALSVQGQSESQLPEITLPNISGLQIYPDTPQKDRAVNEKGILGKRVEKFAIIPSTEGVLTIPAISLKWWDIKNNVEKTASIPARTFKVLAGEKSSQPQINLPKLPTPVTQTVSVDNEAVKFWQMVSAALFALWLLTMVAYFAKKSHKPSKLKVTEPNKHADDHTLALKNAKKALKTNSPDEVANAIITMVNTLKNGQYHSLGAIAHQISNDQLIKKLSALDEQRYSASQQSATIAIKNEDLFEIIKAVSAKRKNAASSAIPPLYMR